MSDPIHPLQHPHLDSIQLRLIAEAASGFRGRPVHFVATPGGDIREVTHRPAQQPGASPPEGGAVTPPSEPTDDDVVIPAFTQDMVPEKPRLSFAALQAHGVAEPINLLDLPNGLGPADAVFWSESAVEKFLLPYYASVYGNQAAKVVSDILEAFHGDSGTSSGPRATGEEELTYAMAHIPKSEYVMLSDTTDPDLAVLFTDASGANDALSLADFIRRRRERRAAAAGQG